MKKITKILSILIISILSMSIMSGCGAKVEPPESVAQGFFDMIVYNDTTKIQSIGISDDEISPLKDFMKKSIKDGTKNTFKMSGISIEDDDLDKIAEAQLNAMKKIKATITTESSDKQTAIVKIKTNYLKLTEVDEKAGNEALTEIQSMGSTDKKELEKVFVDKYTTKLVESLTSVEPVDDTVEKSFSFTMKKVDVGGKTIDMWVPDNPTTLGKDIATMVTQ